VPGHAGVRRRSPGGWGDAFGELARDAIVRLGQATLENKKDFAVRTELARVFGEKVVSATPLSFAPPAPQPRLFDVFRYNGERVRFDMRLSEMGGWVDTFVIVEAPITFTRAPKPIHFNVSEPEFRPYRDKIIHVVVEDFPAFLSAPWAVEFWQRDCAVSALSGVCFPGDLVLLPMSTKSSIGERWNRSPARWPV
jgi:hypothetical protein